MSDSISDYVKLVEKYRAHSGLFLGAITIALLFFFSFFDNFFSNWLNLNQRGLEYVLIWLLCFLFWLRFRYQYPKNNIKKQIGIVIMLYAEDQDKEKMLKNDFIKELKNKITSLEVSPTINVIQIPNHLSENRPKTEAEFEKLHKKTQGHFYISGHFIERKDPEDKLFLQMNGYIRHAEIHESMKNLLKQDFAKVMPPNELAFSKDYAFKNLKVNADKAYIAVRYITGVSAFLSGNPNLAYKLHKGLREEFRTRNLERPFPDIKNRLDKLISDEHYWLSTISLKQNDWEKGKIECQKALEANSGNYGAWLTKSMIDFQHDKDPSKALKSVKKAKQYGQIDWVWRCNEIFLHLWLEKYPKVLSLSKKLPHVSNDPEAEKIVDDMVKFDLKTLEENPEKTQIYYWVGILYYKLLDNIAEALQYFDLFIKKTEDPSHPLMNKAKSYSQIISNKIGCSN